MIKDEMQALIAAVRMQAEDWPISQEKLASCFVTCYVLEEMVNSSEHLAQLDYQLRSYLQRQIESSYLTQTFASDFVEFHHLLISGLERILVTPLGDAEIAELAAQLADVNWRFLTPDQLAKLTSEAEARHMAVQCAVGLREANQMKRDLPSEPFQTAYVAAFVTLWKQKWRARR